MVLEPCEKYSVFFTCGWSFHRCITIRDEAIMLIFYRLCYSPMLHILSDYAPPYSDYAPTCSNYALQIHSYRLDMVLSFPPGMQNIFSIRNFPQLVWEDLDTFCWRYSPLYASCRCYSLRIQIEATLDRGPWKGTDGGLRILLVLRFLHMIIV